LSSTDLRTNTPPIHSRARNVTLAELDGILPSLAPDAKIVAYCCRPYCVYAHQAVAVLRGHGLNARRLEGGMLE